MSFLNNLQDSIPVTKIPQGRIPSYLYARLNLKYYFGTTKHHEIVEANEVRDGRWEFKIQKPHGDTVRFQANDNLSFPCVKHVPEVLKGNIR